MFEEDQIKQILSQLEANALKKVENIKEQEQKQELEEWKRKECKQ